MVRNLQIELETGFLLDQLAQDLDGGKVNNIEVYFFAKKNAVALHTELILAEAENKNGKIPELDQAGQPSPGTRLRLVAERS